MRECSGLERFSLWWCGLASMACAGAVGLDGVSPVVAGGLVVTRRRRFLTNLVRPLC
ncbi:hypothetical protein KSP39_PZI013524 [Platanthera zijinensis]|uniref:Uncharacterized protein n=1 Tax=Platanthera zijinensis TaxID=2320716 RepID=A0AAP0BEL8_9ASPA